MEASIVLRDVALLMRPLEGGAIEVDVVSADAQTAAAACHSCGEEPDIVGDDTVTQAFEDAAEAWIARLGTRH